MKTATLIFSFACCLSLLDASPTHAAPMPRQTLVNSGEYGVLQQAKFFPISGSFGGPVDGEQLWKDVQPVLVWGTHIAAFGGGGVALVGGIVAMAKGKGQLGWGIAGAAVGAYAVVAYSLLMPNGESKAQLLVGFGALAAFGVVNIILYAARRKARNRKLRKFQKTRKLRKFQKTRKLRKFQKNRKLREFQKNRKLREFQEIRKLREFQEIRKLREAQRIRKLREAQRSRKLREAQKIRKLREAQKIRTLREAQKAARRQARRGTRGSSRGYFHLDVH